MTQTKPTTGSVSQRSKKRLSEEICLECRGVDGVHGILTISLGDVLS
jgi:hypothetical protein